MDWITEPWIALAALVLSVLVAVAQVVGFFLRAPRVHWVLDSFEVEHPETGTWGVDVTGERFARFTFRNAGTATAYLAEVSVRQPDGRWMRYGDRVNITIRPEETFAINVLGNLTQRLDVPQVWWSGDGFWFETTSIVRFTWAHRPARLHWRSRYRFRLEKRQLEAKIQIVKTLSPE